MLIILNKQKTHFLKILAAGLFVALSFYFSQAPATFAQTIPQGSNSGLQSQTGQTQTTNNQLGQTGTPQSNTGSNVLDQNGYVPLGVVSSPNQKTPEAVVTPSPSLKADVSKTTSSSSTSIIFLVVGAIILVITLPLVAWRLKSRDIEEEWATEEEAAFRPEEYLTYQPKQKRLKKKRKKAHRR